MPCSETKYNGFKGSFSHDCRFKNQYPSYRTLASPDIFSSILNILDTSLDHAVYVVYQGFIFTSDTPQCDLRLGA